MNVFRVFASAFYKYDLLNGTFGRMVFSFKACEGRDGRIPCQGKYDEAVFRRVDEFLTRLSVGKLKEER